MRRTSPLYVVAAALVAAAGIVWALLPDDPGSRPVAAPAAPPPSAGVHGDPTAVDLPFPLLVTTPAEVHQVVRFCREAGPQSIAPLRHAALRSSDPLVAGNALRALGRLGAVSGDPALESLLADPRPRVRQETILALGRSGDPAAAERLLPLLESPDPNVRPLAIRALGQLGTEVGHRRILALSHDPSLTSVERVLIRDVLSGRVDTASPRGL